MRTTPLRRPAFAALVALAAVALVGCGGAEADEPSQATTTTAAETGDTDTTSEARVASEYHDEYGHGHCYVTELPSGDEVVLCFAQQEQTTRIACFTREEAAGTRNAMGLLRVNGSGKLVAQEQWPASCAEGLDVVLPDSGLNEQAKIARA